MTSRLAMRATACLILAIALGTGCASEDEVRDDVRAAAPNDVRIGGCQRVTVGFGGWWVCDVLSRDGRPCEVEAWWSGERLELHFEGDVREVARPVCRRPDGS